MRFVDVNVVAVGIGQGETLLRVVQGLGEIGETDGEIAMPFGGLGALCRHFSHTGPKDVTGW
jgi:hypothetical protein